MISYQPASALQNLSDSQLSLAGRFVRDIGNDVTAAVSNIRQVQLELLSTEQQSFPISINPLQRVAHNCYVVSPYAMYIDYAKDELYKLNNKLLETCLKPVIAGFAKLLDWANIDRLVILNNYLVSTNLYDTNTWLKENINQLVASLKQRYPQHAIALRSLNDQQHAALISKLKTAGFIAVPSRQVYIAENPLSKRDSRKDQKLCQHSNLQKKLGSDFSPEDYAQCKALYDQLYLEKYSKLNPHYQSSWLAQGQASGWLTLRGLHAEGQPLTAALGWLQTADCITTPIFGFDTQQALQNGLYRQLNYCTFEHAKQQQKIINMSSGAANFKRNRGAIASIEYTLVYCQHLPKITRSIWQLLSSVLVYGAVPLLKKLQL